RSPDAAGGRPGGGPVRAPGHLDRFGAGPRRPGADLADPGTDRSDLGAQPLAGARRRRLLLHLGVVHPGPLGPDAGSRLLHAGLGPGAPPQSPARRVLGGRGRGRAGPAPGRVPAVGVGDGQWLQGDTGGGTRAARAAVGCIAAAAGATAVRGPHLRRAAAAAAALTWALALAGCWDYTDIDRRGIVLGIGVEFAQGEEPLLDVTVDIANPSVIAGGGGGPLTGSAPSQGALILTQRAGSVAEALHSLQARVDRRLALPFVQVVILHEEVARRALGTF